MSHEHIYIDDVEVTDIFFEPLTSGYQTYPRCILFQEEWKRYASLYYADDFVKIILRIISPCTADDAQHASRLATSIIVSFGTNNGLDFMNRFLKEVDPLAPSYNNTSNFHRVLSLWAIENSLLSNNNGCGGRRLQGIIGKIQPPQPLTNLEIDTAERLMMWLAEEKGTKLLHNLKKISDRFLKKQDLERDIRTAK